MGAQRRNNWLENILTPLPSFFRRNKGGGSDGSGKTKNLLSWANQKTKASIYKIAV
jgi:hypothetical protein